MRRLAATLLLLAVSAPLWGQAGQVLDAGTGQPLAGVTITVRWFNGERELAPGTDGEGRFALQPEQFFTVGTAAPRSLTLTFAHEGYVPETLLLEPDASGGFSWSDRTIRLALAEGGAGPASGEHNTLYVLPYRVSTGSAVTDEAEVQALIAEYLTSGLDIYLQEIPEPPPLEAFGLETLADAVEIGNTRAVLAVGSGLKDALAVVGGQARIAGEGSGQVEFSSRYVMVPAVEGMRGRVLRWDDALPAGLVSARAIADQLNRLWGRNTVLAIGVAGYNRARTLAPAERSEMLGRVAAFLRAELRDAGADEPLVTELKELLTRVEEGRTP